jgi:hypothetical protein
MLDVLIPLFSLKHCPQAGMYSSIWNKGGVTAQLSPGTTDATVDKAHTHQNDWHWHGKFSNGHMTLLHLDAIFSGASHLLQILISFS